MELDARAKLGEEDQVENDRSGQERVLASVVKHNGAFPTHEYLRGVLIHGSLAVPNIWHILQTQQYTIRLITYGSLAILHRTVAIDAIVKFSIVVVTLMTTT